ncbi:type II toxin-antitoxin system HicA family toxin [Candidatus Parcubacteria bacterium]|nr:type II toxin-antitoxin system HicA family toxin [Candidatus Parcubacteria bacterium]
MPKLSPISAKKMFKILKKLGFELIRVKGSHHFFLNNKTGKTTTVPFHTREDLSVGLLREILKDIELSVKEYEKIRK